MSAFPEHLRSMMEEYEIDVPTMTAVGYLFDAVFEVGVATLPDQLWLACARALSAHEDGHTLLDLTSSPAVVGLLTGFPELIANVSGAGDADGVRRPFVVENSALYVTRAWHEERAIADAVRLAVSEDRLHILLGGPGAGKTTEVARRLVERLSESGADASRIALAAPTGKAADRMRKAIESALERGNESGPYPPDVVERVRSIKPVTLHRLLGYSMHRKEGRYKFGPEEYLPFDMVIVDETSMMSMSMMYRLLGSLRPDAPDKPGSELLLVGDPDQLVSVEAGSVLGDLRRVGVEGGLLAHPVTEFLQGQHRFDANSNLGRFIGLVRGGDEGQRDVDAALALLEDCRRMDPSSSTLSFIDPTVDEEAFSKLAGIVRDQALSVVEAAASGDARTALNQLSKMQVLCATHRGKSGVSTWNRSVNTWIGPSARRTWFAGRPVLVTRNDYSNRVYNGDVGVVVRRPEGDLEVAFPDAGDPRLLATVRLPDVATVHALTIHKSQGSEYDHVIVVLPYGESRLLTRELLYTAASRARRRLTVVATPEAIRSAMSTKVRRSTKLADRLSSTT